MPDALAPVRLLYVEDDAATARATCILLASLGHEVQHAPDRDMAMQLIERGFRPEVLLMDFQLGPGPNGSEVAEEIMQSLGHSVPVILLSGDLPNVEVPWMPGAPLLMMSKPMQPQALLETLEHFAVLRRLTARRVAAPALR